MKQYNKITPDGTRDLLFDECVLREAVTDRLTAMFRDDMKQSTRLRADEWHRRPVITKSIESVLRLLSPIL